MSDLQPAFLSQPPSPPNASKDYRTFKNLLISIDSVLAASLIEQGLINEYEDIITARIEQSGKTMSEGWVNRALAVASFAIRCNILRRLMNLDYRKFSAQASDSALMQWFLYRGRIEGFIGQLEGKWLSKSALERYDKIFPADEIQKAISRLCACVSNEAWKNKLPGWQEHLSIRDIWADCTCLEADIHYPVDWVLLRDAVRTLVKAIICLRNHGLKHRIADPKSFMSAINKASIEMSAVLRGKNSRKQRKRVLRTMKAIVKLVQGHAVRYRDILDNERASRTDLTPAEAMQIKDRIDSVLLQLPAAIKQAEDRIVRKRPIPDAEKVLSLYEPDVHVIVRGKARSMVEFGNTLYLAENRDGLIVDHHLYRDRAPADCKMLGQSISRIRQAYGGLDSVTTDRGFDSPENSQLLAEESITNYILPKSPKRLAKSFEDPVFRDFQKRRAQTEGRIGILKNGFIGNRLSGKGFEHQRIEVTWCIFAHNLWVLGRIAQKMAGKLTAQDNLQKAS